MKGLIKNNEIDIGQKFADSAICDVAIGEIGKLEELLNTGSMMEWGRVVSEIGDKDLAILSVGLTNKGRHFLLAGLADERLQKVVGIFEQIECDMSDNAETIAKMILEKWKKI